MDFITVNIDVFGVQWRSHIPIPLKYFNLIIEFSVELMR
jgi:hypothetical protein